MARLGFGKKKKENEEKPQRGNKRDPVRREVKPLREEEPKKPVTVYEPTPGKKLTVFVVIVIAIILLAAGITYLAIFPRTSLDVQTVYHERLGGGSTGGGININILFSNGGTRKITGLEYTLTVINQSDAQVLRVTENVGQLEARDHQEVSNGFIGNHLETYYITLSISFSAEGKNFKKDFSYKTEEDAMNLDFRDTVD